MKITKQQLKIIIKEELDNVMNEMAPIEESPARQGVEVVSQKVSKKDLMNPRVAKELQQVKGKSSKELAAMLSESSLEEAEEATDLALRQGSELAPKEKAMAARKIMKEKLPMLGAVGASAIFALAATAPAAALGPLGLVVWAVGSMIGYAAGDAAADFIAPDPDAADYSMAGGKDSVLETRRRRRK